MTDKKDKNETIILLDVHALLHRAYHALPDFKTKDGKPTGALYGLSTMIVKLASDFKPEHIIACYDLPEKTHRHIAYEEYKAKRAKIDDDLIEQIDSSRELFDTFNIPIYEAPGFEADDILGTIVEQTNEKKDKSQIFKRASIIIASGDMDTLQLAEGKRVQIFTLKKGISDTVMYSEEGVNKRFGFGPELLPDYKGLRGDPSDNIIGVPGIGEKTATVLITQFGTLENIYKVLKKSTEKLKKAGLTDRIINLLNEHEEDAMFSKMLATIRRDAPIKFKLPKGSFKENLDIDKIEDLFKRLEFRTLGHRFKNYIGVGGEGPIPIPEKKAPIPSGANKKAKESGEKPPPEIAVALFLLDSSLAKPTLEDLYEISGKNDIKEAKVEVLRLIKEYDLTKIYEEIEKPLIPIIDKMERNGIKIDVKYLEELGKAYHKNLDGLEKKIWEEAGEEFNISSPKQMGETLFTKLNLNIKGLKKTAGGAQSTKESELMKLIDAHPIIPLILEFRELSKLLTTYIDVIPKLVDGNNRLHTHFIQTGAVTGRMASSDPNLQNIPIKSELGRNIRKGFITEKNYTLAAFDYSQIELRMAAILSEDEKLMDIFKKGEDVHNAVAAQVFKVKPSEVTKEMRRKAKVINFGILYGMGVNALKVNLGGTREEAKKFYDEYFETFKTLAVYLERVKRDVRGMGYTKTIWGRRRYFPEINSKLPFIRASAERMAINAPIQGSQADLIKRAMVLIDEHIKKEKLEEDVRLLLQVHDEVIYEIKDECVQKVSKAILDIMKNVMDKKDTKGVPILAHGSIGPNWDSLEEI